jgi:hypothetical protein
LKVLAGGQLQQRATLRAACAMFALTVRLRRMRLALSCRVPELRAAEVVAVAEEVACGTPRSCRQAGICALLEQTGRRRLALA